MQTQHGVFVGRFCPLHLGHEAVIRKMLGECGARQSLVIIGSANEKMSLRHFFSYGERRGLLKAIFPDLRIVPLPDFWNDAEWLTALDDILTEAGFDPKSVTFFGGCDEDVRFFTTTGRRVEITNRYDGSTPKISATEVRDALIHGRPLDGLANPLIAETIRKIFRTKWQAFERM